MVDLHSLEKHSFYVIPELKVHTNYDKAAPWVAEPTGYAAAYITCKPGHVLLYCGSLGIQGARNSAQSLLELATEAPALQVASEEGVVATASVEASQYVGTHSTWL